MIVIDCQWQLGDCDIIVIDCEWLLGDCNIIVISLSIIVIQLSLSHVTCHTSITRHTSHINHTSHVGHMSLISHTSCHMSQDLWLLWLWSMIMPNEDKIRSSAFHKRKLYTIWCTFSLASRIYPSHDLCFFPHWEKCKILEKTRHFSNYTS